MNPLPADNQSASHERPEHRMGIGRVLCLVIPLAVAVIAAAFGWVYFDVGNRIARWTMPQLVPVTGQVYLDGKPLADAAVYTQPTDRRYRGALGVTDAEGRFALRTDIQGTLEAGAVAGEHVVTVAKRDGSKPVGPAPMPLLTPAVYAEFETTPLRIQVGRDPRLNHVEFRLESKAVTEKAGEGDLPALTGPAGPATTGEPGQHAPKENGPGKDEKPSPEGAKTAPDSQPH